MWVQACTAGPCPVGAAQPATVLDITNRLDLHLDDERLIRLAGVEALADRDAEAARTELTALLKGRIVLVRALAPKVDRWGRWTAQVFGPMPELAGTPADAAVPHINEALVAAGLVRVQPSVGADDCLKNLLVAETEAREAGFGLWADPANAPLDATDSETLAARNGQFVLVQGTVRRVGQGRARAYLDFGKGRGDFSVTVAKRQLRLFAKAGWSLESLAGRVLRVRGIIDTRFGPQIEISGPEEIEIIDASGEEALTKAVDKGVGR